MFLGKYSHNIDAKGRIIIPAKFREQLGEQFVITNGFDIAGVALEKLGGES